jgi:hypothetical protein
MSSGYVIATGGGHLADEVLMQILDGDPSPSTDARAHLEVCAHCARRFSALESAAHVLRVSLVDVPMPRIELRARRRRPWMMPIPIAAAATIVVLASAAAATPPIRNWIMHRLSPPPSPIVGPAHGTTAAPRSARAGVIASFMPTDTILAVRIDRAQSSGSLQLIAAAGDKVSAEAVGRTDADELLVMPTGIRVTNSASSVTDYRVSVPLSVRLIRISIAGKETAVVVNDGRLDRRIRLR